MHHSLGPFFSVGKLSSGLQGQEMDTVARGLTPSCPGLDHLDLHISMQILGLQRNLNSKHADDGTLVVVAVKVAS